MADLIDMHATPKSNNSDKELMVKMKNKMETMSQTIKKLEQQLELHGIQPGGCFVSPIPRNFVINTMIVTKGGSMVLVVICLY